MYLHKCKKKANRLRRTRQKHKKTTKMSVKRAKRKRKCAATTQPLRELNKWLGILNEFLELSRQSIWSVMCNLFDFLQWIWAFQLQKHFLSYFDQIYYDIIYQYIISLSMISLKFHLIGYVRGKFKKPLC